MLPIPNKGFLFIKFSMEFLEKDLEQIIFETDNEILVKRGFLINGKKIRQLRIGNYGIADIVTFWRNRDIISFEVFELKKDVINITTLLQAYNYVKGIDHYLKSRGFKTKFYITLVGRKIDISTSFCFLPDLIDNLSFFTYNFDIDGLKFTTCSDFNLINTGFNYDRAIRMDKNSQINT